MGRGVPRSRFFPDSIGGRIFATFRCQVGMRRCGKPWRMALSYLRDAFGSGALPDLSLLREVPEKQIALVDAMIARRIQTLETSSCGRLFDAVAALTGLGRTRKFRGAGCHCVGIGRTPGSGTTLWFPHRRQ